MVEWEPTGLEGAVICGDVYDHSDLRIVLRLDLWEWNLRTDWIRGRLANDHYCEWPGGDRRYCLV